MSMKKLPTTMSGMKNTQLNALPMASLVWKQNRFNVRPAVDVIRPRRLHCTLYVASGGEKFTCAARWLCWLDLQLYKHFIALTMTYRLEYSCNLHP